MKWMMILTLLIVTAACASSAPPRRSSAVGLRSTQADFGRYQTFGFGSANPPAAGCEISDRSIAVHTTLAPLVRSMLEARGYTLHTDRPDLVIKISAGSGAMAVEGTPGVMLATPVGLMGVVSYDGQTGAYVWHGSAIAEVDREQIDDGLLARGLESMLIDFPARQTTLSSAAVLEPAR